MLADKLVDQTEANAGEEPHISDNTNAESINLESTNPAIKKVRIRTADIPTEWLNAHCRNLIAKYALIAFREDGTVFDLRSDDLLSKLSKHSREAQHADLQELYQLLKKELRAIIAAPSRKTAVTILAEKFSYLADGQVSAKTAHILRLL